MKLKIKKDGLEILPENEQDLAFINDTLGLNKNGKELTLKRVRTDVDIPLNEVNEVKLIAGTSKE